MSTRKKRKESSKVLAIVGSRTFYDYPLLKQECEEFIKLHGSCTVISGGAPGADKLAEAFAEELGLPLEVIRPEWVKDGQYHGWAGFARNTEIVENATHVIAFWDKKSKGTKDTITKAKKSGKLYKLVEFNK